VRAGQLRIRTLRICYSLLLFHDNNNYINAPQYCVISALPVLLSPRRSVFTARYELNVYVQFRLVMVFKGFASCQVLFKYRKTGWGADPTFRYIQLHYVTLHCTVCGYVTVTFICITLHYTTQYVDTWPLHSIALRYITLHSMWIRDRYSWCKVIYQFASRKQWCPLATLSCHRQLTDWGRWFYSRSD
jgi:hypothetical protein